MLEIILFAAIVVLDQCTKYFGAQWLQTLPGNTFPIIEDVLHLTYAENRGAAFGLLQNARWFFIVLTAIACVAIIIFYIKERKGMHTLMRVYLALILGGAVGNLIDRIALGYVRDFIYVVAIDFPVFNVADSAVSVGGVLLLIDMIFLKGRVYLDRLDDKGKKSKQQGDTAEEISMSDNEQTDERSPIEVTGDEHADTIPEDKD